MERDSTRSDELVLFDRKSPTVAVAVGAILASVFVVAELFPISLFIGSTVLANITLSIAIAPLFGILLGPWRGAAFGLVAGILRATLIGGLSLVVPTIIFGPAISGLLTGLCVRAVTDARGHYAYGPLLTSLYVFVIIILYMIPNAGFWWFMLPYMCAGVVALIFALRGSDIRRSLSSSGGLTPAIIIALALVGTITDFSMMTMGAVYILQIPGEVFGYLIFPVMLAERTFATVASALVAATVLRAVPELV
ncbi:MAG: hypothetical protein QXS20_04875 [Candidatus Thorarchaeota archaeon]